MRLITMLVALCVLGVLPKAVHADDAVYLYVLGIAQDAGYPQAGCYKPHCLPGWETPALRRLASSVAIVDESVRGKLLFDATPDLPEQLYRLERQTGEGFDLLGVFPTHGHIGHYTGLMHFGREVMGADNVPVYAMPRMARFLSSNGPWDQLIKLENIRLQALEDNRLVKFGQNMSVTAFTVPHRDEYTETVGFRIKGPDKTAVYIPDIDKWHEWETPITELVQSVDYALLDATFYAEGEIPGRAMADIPHPFVQESMQVMAGLTMEEKSRVYFIHMNHTNPVLLPDSAERKLVEEAGFNVAEEGLRLDL